MNKILTLTLSSMVVCILLAACSAKSEEVAPVAAPVEESAQPSPTEEPEVEVIADDIVPENSEPLEADDETGEDVTEEAVTEDTNTESSAKTKAIVWLGDSLTQGSLGDENDNLANAPYEKLKQMVNVPVEGYGMYGWKTHDIFWAYIDEAHFNQDVDPEKTYIFWVGSCDWCPDDSVNSDTAPVIAEIDGFLARGGGIKNYIVLGTTSRWRLGDLYIPINKDLAAHYGNHYMDVIDIINKYGYSPDNTHLSQGSYDAIAAAVYEKLKSLGYI